MPRKLRVEYAGAIYHLMNRGDRRESIFVDNEDRRLFLETLGERIGVATETEGRCEESPDGGATACGDDDELAVDCAPAGDGPLAEGTQCNSGDHSTKTVNSERTNTPLVISDPFYITASASMIRICNGGQIETRSVNAEAITSTGSP